MNYQYSSTLERVLRMYLRPSDINIGRGPVKLNGFIIDTKIIYPVISIDGIFFLIGMIDDYLLPSSSPVPSLTSSIVNS